MTKKALIKEYVLEIERLKNCVAAARSKNGIYLPPEEYEEMQETIKTQTTRMQQFEEEIEMLNKKSQEIQCLFSETKETLHKTERDLLQTSSKLEETKQELSGTQTKLAEHSYALGEHVCTQEVLHKNASVILETLTSAEKDVDALHAKVGRTRAKEESNLKVGAHLQGELRDWLGVHTSSFSDFERAQNRKNAGLSVSLESFADDLRKDVRSLGDSTVHLSNSISHHKSSLSNLLDTQNAHISSQLVSWRVDQQEKLDEVEKDIQAVEREGATIFSEIKNLHLENLAGEEVCAKEVRAGVESEREVVRKSVEEERGRMEKAVGLIRSEKEQMDSFLSSRSEILRSFISQQEEKVSLFQKTLLETVEKAISHFVSQQKSEVNDLAMKMEESISLSKQSLNTLSSNAVQKIEDSNSYLRDLSNQLDSHFLRTHSSVQKAEERAQKFCASSQALLRCVEELHAQSAKGTSEKLRSLGKCEEDKKARLLEKLHEMQALREENLMRSEEKLCGEVEEMNKRMDIVSSNIERYHKQSSECLSEISRDLHQFTCDFAERQKKGDDIASFVDNITPLQPTGLTPIKREIKYPSDLPKTKELEQLFSDFRKKIKLEDSTATVSPIEVKEVKEAKKSKKKSSAILKKTVSSKKLTPLEETRRSPLTEKENQLNN